jgi:hypothetical protein
MTLKPVLSVEPNYTRCRAAVLGGARVFQQCSRVPFATRQHKDGSLYRVSGQHKRAKWFVPWTSQFQMSHEDALAAAQRAIARLPSLLR